jgi:6-phosphogluconolactonase (cycloisomerase 2 family)
MPLLSTRAAASSAGYGQNLNAGQNVFNAYGYAPFYDSAYERLGNFEVSADGTALFCVSADFISGISLYSWAVHSYIRDVATGRVTFVSTTILGNYGTSSVAFLTISPDSKNLYVTVANNPTSTIDSTNVLFQYNINSTTKNISALTPATINVGTGAGVMSPSLSPDGKFLYIGSYSLNRILIYSRNTTSGVLTYSNVFFTPTNTIPWCPIVTEDNSFLYTSSYGTDTSKAILQYSRNTVTGDLTALSPEGIAGGAKMRYLNFNPAQIGIHCAGETSGLVYIYSRNSGTGQITSVATQGGTLFKVTFSSDGTIMLGAQAPAPSTNMTTQSAFQGTIAPGTGAVTPYTNPKFVAISQFSLLEPSPSFDYYYSFGAGTVFQWQLVGGYLELVECASPEGAKLNYGDATAVGKRSTSFLAISPDQESLYANGYWYTGALATRTKKGSQFDLAIGTGIPTRATATSDGTQQGPNGIVISSDSAFLYQIDVSVNPIVIRQYSRNTTTGNLTALSTPTLNLPTPNTWASTSVKDCYGYPVLSNDGNNLYVSFHSGNSGVSANPYIVQFSRDTGTGLLTLIGTVNIGSYSGFGSEFTATENAGYDVCVHPNDNFVFCPVRYGSSPGQIEIVTFSRNTSTGVLTQISTLNLSPYSSATSGFTFACLSPDGSNLYFNSADGRFFILSVNASTGAVTFVTFKTYSGVNGDYRIVMLPNGNGIVTFSTATTKRGFVLIKRSTSGDLANTLSSPFVFNAPLVNPISSLDFSPNAFAVSSDSSKFYYGSSDMTFGTLSS